MVFKVRTTVTLGGRHTGKVRRIFSGAEYILFPDLVM